jgi:hypothetical protein
MLAIANENDAGLGEGALDGGEIGGCDWGDIGLFSTLDRSGTEAGAVCEVLD